MNLTQYLKKKIISNLNYFGRGTLHKSYSNFLTCCFIKLKHKNCFGKKFKHFSNISLYISKIIKDSISMFL